MILKSFFSVWLCKDDYNNLQINVRKSDIWVDRDLLCPQNPDTIIVPENCKYSARDKTNSDQWNRHLLLKYQIKAPLSLLQESVERDESSQDGLRPRLGLLAHPPDKSKTRSTSTGRGLDKDWTS